MIVDYNANTQEVYVPFRGGRATLPQKYDTLEKAKTAGEKYCRNQGWSG